MIYSIIKAPLAVAKAPLRTDTVHLYVRLPVFRQNPHTNRDFLKY